MIKLLRLFKVAVLCGMPLLITAQPTLSNAYFPAAGDTLVTQVDVQPPALELFGPGGPHVWNFTALRPAITRRRPVVAAAGTDGAGAFPQTELVLPLGEGAAGYYDVTATNFDLAGYYGEDPLGQGLVVTAPFDPPYVERWAPLAFFDIRTSEAALLFAAAADDIPGDLFDQLPVPIDSVRIRIAIDRVDAVDAYGTVQLPGAGFPVLRERRTEIRDVRLDAKAGFLPWTDITDLVLAYVDIEGLGQDTLMSYTFWSEGVKEPIAVVRVQDFELLEITTVEFKATDLTLDADEPTAAAAALVLTPNPATDQVRIQYAGAEAGVYQFLLLTPDGREVMRRSFFSAGALDEAVEVAALPQGVYVVALVQPSGRWLRAGRLVKGK